MRLLVIVVLLIAPQWVHADNWKRFHSAGEEARKASDFATAERQYHAAIEEARKSHDDVKLATSQHGLALSLASHEQYAEAEPLFRESLAAFDRVKPDSAEVGYVLNNLAWMYGKQRRYAEAEPLHKRALRIREREGGYYDIAIAVEDLAFLYQAMGRYKEAEEAWDRSMREWARFSGVQKPGATMNLANVAETNEMAHSLYNSGVFYFFMGRYGEGGPLLRRSLEIWEKKLGREDPNVGNAAEYLGMLETDRRNYATAEQLLRRALAISEKNKGASDWANAHIAALIADTMTGRGAFADAEGLLERARVLVEPVRATHQWSAGTILFIRAKLLAEEQCFEDAERLLRESLLLLDHDPTLQPFEIVQRAGAKGLLATILTHEERAEDAERLYREALGMLDNGRIAEHPRALPILDGYAALLWKGGRVEEAGAVENRASAIRAREGLPGVARSIDAH